MNISLSFFPVSREELKEEGPESREQTSVRWRLGRECREIVTPKQGSTVSICESFLGLTSRPAAEAAAVQGYLGMWQNLDV